MAMSPWQIETDPLRVRRLGKTLEEINELGAVLARCTIQGIDEIDPSSGKTNRQRLEEETADVLAQIVCNIEALALNRPAIHARRDEKIRQMVEWESIY